MTASSIVSLNAANGPPNASGNARRLVVADGDQLELAQQQRHEAEEDHRVHQARPPFAPDHAPLQQAVDEHAAQALPGLVPARLGLQREHDPAACARRARRSPRRPSSISTLMPAGPIASPDSPGASARVVRALGRREH